MKKVKSTIRPHTRVSAQPSQAASPAQETQTLQVSHLSVKVGNINLEVASNTVRQVQIDTGEQKVTIQTGPAPGNRTFVTDTPHDVSGDAPLAEDDAETIDEALRRVNAGRFDDQGCQYDPESDDGRGDLYDDAFDEDDDRHPILTFLFSIRDWLQDEVVEHALKRIAIAMAVVWAITFVNDAFTSYQAKRIEEELSAKNIVTVEVTTDGTEYYRLTVRYVDMGGTNLAPSYQTYLAAGQDFAMSPRLIAGYTPLATTVSGVMEAKDTEILIYYQTDDSSEYQTNPFNDPYYQGNAPTLGGPNA